MTPEQAEQMTRGVVGDCVCGLPGHDRCDWCRYSKDISAALLSTNPPDGSVTLPGGSVVEVVGNLVVTGDGKVVGEGVMNLWSINGNQRTVRGPSHYEARVTGAHPFAWSELFTTREAAEAAAKEM